MSLRFKSFVPFFVYKTPQSNRQTNKQNRQQPIKQTAFNFPNSGSRWHYYATLKKKLIKNGISKERERIKNSTTTKKHPSPKKRKKFDINIRIKQPYRLNFLQKLVNKLFYNKWFLYLPMLFILKQPTCLGIISAIKKKFHVLYLFFPFSDYKVR